MHASAIVNLPCRATGGRLSIWLSLGKKETVNRLRSRGAGADIRDNNGNIALHVAAAIWTVAMVERLLHARSDVSKQNSDGETPLEIATARGSSEVMQYLADFGTRRRRLMASLEFSHCQRLVRSYFLGDEG